MKTVCKILATLLLIGNSFNGFSQNEFPNTASNWHEINTSGKMVAFSKIAKIGKISIFVISTDWCPPCKQLRADFLEIHRHYPDVDFYYVNMSSGLSYAELQNTNGYMMWRTIERLKEWPTVYMFSPTTNFVTRFNKSQLEAEKYAGGLFDKSFEIVERLREYSNSFSQERDLIIENKKVALVNRDFGYSPIESVDKPTLPVDLTEQRDGFEIYIVKDGDSFASISKSHGFSYKEVSKWNKHIVNIRHVIPGDKIFIKKKELKEQKLTSEFDE